MAANYDGQLLELDENTDYTEGDLPSQPPSGPRRKIILGIGAAILASAAAAIAVAWQPDAGTVAEVQNKEVTELTSQPVNTKCKYGVKKIGYENYLPTEKYSFSANCNQKNRVITVCFNYNKDEWYGMGGAGGSPCADKLTNSKLFGRKGKVKYPIKTVRMKGTITAKALSRNKCDIFHIGLADADAYSKLTYKSLSKSSVKALKKWAEHPYHVILGFQSFATTFGDYGQAKTGATNPMTATELGSVVTEKGAPFGRVGSFKQGGSWRGTLTDLDKSSCVLIQDKKKKPIAVLDTNLGSIFLSDTDLLTTLGGITKGKTISSANDKLLGNLYAFMTGITCNGAPSNCHFKDTPVEICKPKPKGKAAVIVSFMFSITTKIEISVLVTSVKFMEALKIVFASVLQIDVAIISKIQLVEWQGQLQVILGFGCGCATKEASKFEATFKSATFFKSFAYQLSVKYSKVTVKKVLTVTTSVYTSISKMTTAFKVYGTKAVSCTMDLGIKTSYSITKLISISSFKLAFIKVMALRLKIMTSMVQVSFQQIGSKLQAVFGIIGCSSKYSSSFKASISKTSFVTKFISSVTKEYRKVTYTGSIKINVQIFTSIYKMTQTISIFGGGGIVEGVNGGNAAVAATCSLGFGAGWSTKLAKRRVFISMMKSVMADLLEVKASTILLNLKAKGSAGAVATYAVKDCSTSISTKLELTFQSQSFMQAIVQQIQAEFTGLFISSFSVKVTVYSTFTTLVKKIPCGCFTLPNSARRRRRKGSAPMGGRLLAERVHEAEVVGEGEELSSAEKVFTSEELAAAQHVSMETVSSASLPVLIPAPGETESDAAGEVDEYTEEGEDEVEADTYDGPEESFDFVVDGTEIEAFQERMDEDEGAADNETEHDAVDDEENNVNENDEDQVPVEDEAEAEGLAEDDDDDDDDDDAAADDEQDADDEQTDGELKEKGAVVGGEDEDVGTPI